MSAPAGTGCRREAARTLICGDVFFNMHVPTTIPSLRQPPDLFTPNPTETGTPGRGRG